MSSDLKEEGVVGKNVIESNSHNKKESYEVKEEKLQKNQDNLA